MKKFNIQDDKDVTEPFITKEEEEVYRKRRQQKRKDKNIALMILFVICVLIYIFGFTDVLTWPTELVYVFELNRHGARSPTDIYKDNNTYGFSMKIEGQLTPLGVR